MSAMMGAPTVPQIQRLPVAPSFSEAATRAEADAKQRNKDGRASNYLTRLGMSGEASRMRKALGATSE